MSDLPESEFSPAVEQWFRKWFAPKSIDWNPILSTGLEPDLLVRTPLNSYVVEVENDLYSAQNNQTAFYAAHNRDDFTPVTVIPAGHREPRDRFDVLLAMTSMLDGYLVELDPETGKGAVHW
jgi:hypothetical protein